MHSKFIRRQWPWYTLNLNGTIDQFQSPISLFYVGILMVVIAVIKCPIVFFPAETTTAESISTQAGIVDKAICNSLYTRTIMCIYKRMWQMHRETVRNGIINCKKGENIPDNVPLVVHRV